MLSKLIKHEWKATWKLPALLCLSILLLSVICCISFYVAGLTKVDTIQSGIVYTYTMAMLLIFYTLLLSAPSIVIILYFSYRFYKNLYTDEGYLMHTLPATPTQLIISKGICAAFWTISVTILTTLGVIALLFYLMSSILMANNVGSIRMLFNEIIHYMPQINELFKQYTGVSLITGFVTSLFLPILGSLSGILLPYMCLSLGQLFKKHRVAAAVGFYFACFFAIQLVSGLISLPFTLKQMFRLTSYANELEEFVAPLFSAIPTYIINYFLSLALSITSFLVTRYIMGKKLNLE